MYRPHAAQQRFHASGKRWLAAIAGARGGKTVAGAAEYIARLYKDVREGRVNDVPATGGRRRRPRWHGWVCAPTAALNAEPKRRLFELIPKEHIEAWYESESALWIKGGYLIEFKSTERSEDLVSVGLQGCWIDEACRVRFEAWAGGIRPRLTDHRGFCLFTSTPLGRGWVHREIVDRAEAGEPDFGHITWPTIANPFIAAEEVAEAKRTLHPRWFSREYEASADAFQGLIIDEFKESIHVRSEKRWRMEHGFPAGQIPFKTVYAGIDFGFVSPSTCIVVGELSSGELAVVDEFYSPHIRPLDPDPERSLAQICTKLQRKWGISRFLADSADPGSIFDLSRAGLPVTGATKNMATGIRRLCNAFRVVGGRPRIQIFDTCTNLIREIKTWSFATNRDGSELTEEPAPNQSDHALDALRYAIYELKHYEPTGIQQPARSVARPLY